MLSSRFIHFASLHGLVFFANVFVPTMRAADAPCIELWPEGVPAVRSAESDTPASSSSVVPPPSLIFFPAPAGQRNGTGIIICPGGGYRGLAVNHEGVEVAHWLNSLGVTAFVLRYRVRDFPYPAPFLDVLRALRWVRAHAADYAIRPDRIGLLGASAGGHLAGCAATRFDAPEGKTGAALDAVSARPDFAVLLYPVVTLKLPFANAGSRWSLLGPKPPQELIERLSIELQVTRGTPPMFLVHAEDDHDVPVENSLLLYQALRAAGVSAELHLYEKGGHGFGLRSKVAPTSGWPKRCEEWMLSHDWLTATADF